MSPLTLTAEQARRIAAAVPFTSVGDARAALHALGALQLDPMSRVERAHRLTTLTRMPTPRAGSVATPATLDDTLWRTGEAQLFEGFVHALCLLPIDYWPLWRKRHAVRAHRFEQDAELLEEWARVRELVAASDAGLTLGELELAESRTTGWNYSRTKVAVERAVSAGWLIVSERRAGVRVFDLPERRIPKSLFEAELSPDEIDDLLVTKALRVLGIGTLRELARLFQVPRMRAEAALGRLVAAGAAVPVAVEGWDAAWVAPESLAVAEAPVKSLRWLGPFDNLMWDRDRIHRIFGLEYRLEAYVPKALRVHGPYALVALVGDRMVGQIDLRADRRAGVLEVVGWVPHGGRVPTARLQASLPGLARSLGLGEVGGLDSLRYSTTHFSG